MRRNKPAILATLVAALALEAASPAQAEILCKDKKTGVVASRAKCKKKAEIAIVSLNVASKSTSASAGTSTATGISLDDTGAVAGGSDFSTGLDVSVRRINATGGTLNSTGIDVSVIGDPGGDSTNVGLSVNTSGADTNYAALFTGGNVGIGITDPDEQLELAGRLHLGQSSAPTTASDKLYNVGGTLFWGGQAVAVGSSTGGTITSVTAGLGLSGGGSSGAVSLSVDTGTGANKIVQLNSNGELPALSGANLNAINATNLASGTLSNARLSASVSLLGPSIGLGSEVAGTLPVANGGTGATSLSNLIALTTQTTGNYVASVATSSGISGGAAGSEGSALSLTLDQSFSPTWTSAHSFLDKVNVGTSSSTSEALHLNGRLEIEPSSSPSSTTNKLYNVGGSLFFNGKDLSSLAAGGDITGVTAGNGLTGGGTSNDVTLAVDVGTTANKNVQLNGSAQLPAVSGANVTSISATNITSGTLPDARLSGSVTQLGSSIALVSEVSGTLPFANGGTGATTLSNLIALGNHTTGNYIGTVAAGGGISVALGGAEGGTATVTLDEAFAPTWTGSHTFSGQLIDITTATNENFAIVPNGFGKVGIGVTSPSAMLDTAISSTSSTAGAETGAEFNLTDTGIVTIGADTSTGVDVNVVRTGASGGTIATTGIDVLVSADTGGTSTATGLNVAVSGADTNYAALFMGGSVGVGTSSPVAQFQTVLGSTSTTGALETASRIDLTDTGIVSTSSDTSIGLDINVARTQASGGTINSTGLDISVMGDTGGTSTAKGLNVAVSGADSNYAAIFTGGNVGIGTSAPTAKFHTDLASTSTTGATERGAIINVADSGIVNSGTDLTVGMDLNVSRTGASGSSTITTTGLNIVSTGDAGGTSLNTGLKVSVSGADSNIAATFTGGSVGVGDTVSVASSNVPSGSLVVGNGALCIDNGGDNCSTSGALTPGKIYADDIVLADVDIAEEFPVEDGDEVSAGDIVVINTHKAQKCIVPDSKKGAFKEASDPTCAHTTEGLVPFVTRAVSGAEKRVIGVVSTNPGVTLGGFGQRELLIYKKTPIALAGRIPVNVSLENGPIEVGDRIIPSSKPGVGMRANSNSDNGIVGIALEPYDGNSEESKVLALVR